MSARTCQGCGVELTGQATRWCGQRCRRRGMVYPPRDCVACGRSFRPKKPHAVTCSTGCGAAWSHRPVDHEATCRRCGAAFAWRGAATARPPRWCSTACRDRLRACAHCGQEFAARKASLRFCSARCAADALIRHGERRCARCGTPFRARTASNVFCGVDCSRAALRPPERPCAWCGELYRRRPGQRYCSMRCGGLATGAQRVEREAVCQVCGSTWTWNGTKNTHPSQWCSPACWRVAHPPPDRDCAWCGKPAGKRVHCSQRCRSASASKPRALVYSDCSACGKLMVRPASGQRKTCSPACASQLARRRRSDTPRGVCTRCGGLTPSPSTRFCSTACRRVRRPEVQLKYADRPLPWRRLALRVEWSDQPLVVVCPSTVGELPGAMAEALRASAAEHGVTLDRRLAAAALRTVRLA